MNTNSPKTDRETGLPKSKARFQRAERRQIQWHPFALDQMIPDEDDTVRRVWAYVEGLDLDELYAQIKAIEGHAGRDPIDPQILLALWLYATIDGVNTARKLGKERGKERG